MDPVDQINQTGPNGIFYETDLKGDVDHKVILTVRTRMYVNPAPWQYSTE
mgnify:CR=1 FL=1